MVLACSAAVAAARRRAAANAACMGAASSCTASSSTTARRPRIRIVNLPFGSFRRLRSINKCRFKCPDASILASPRPYFVRFARADSIFGLYPQEQDRAVLTAKTACPNLDHKQSTNLPQAYQGSKPVPGCAGECGRRGRRRKRPTGGSDILPVSPRIWRRLMVARRRRVRAQSRPMLTLEGRQSLFRAWPAFGVPRQRHLGGGEKGAKARSCWCSARSQTVGCTHPGATFSGSMGRMTPARPAARQ